MLFLVVLPSGDYKNISTLVGYLQNNNTIKQSTKSAIKNLYPKIADKLTCSKRTLNGREISQIISEYKQGALTKELAAKYNCHRSRIHGVLTSHGVKLGRVQSSVRGKEKEIAKLYKSGLNTYKIAERFKVSQSPIVKCLHRQNVEMRLAGKRRKS